MTKNSEVANKGVRQPTKDAGAHSGALQPTSPIKIATVKNPKEK